MCDNYFSNQNNSRSKIQMSFNRSRTGRLRLSLSVQSSCSSTKHMKENVTPTSTIPRQFDLGNMNVNPHTTRNATHQQQQQSSQFFGKTAKTSLLPLNFFGERGGGHQKQQTPLHQRRNDKNLKTQPQVNNRRQKSRRDRKQRDELLLDDNDNHFSTKASRSVAMRRPLTLDVLPIDITGISVAGGSTHNDRLGKIQDYNQLDDSSNCNGGYQVDNFDLIRQLISPVAEDTKHFLEQISLQLKNLPQSDESQRITPQPHPLKALDLSRISDQPITSTPYSQFEEENQNGDYENQAIIAPQAEESSFLADLSQGAAIFNNAPLDNGNTFERDQNQNNNQVDKENRKNADRNSMRLAFLQSKHRSLKNQFDYASLIERNHSLQQISRSTEQSEKKLMKQDVLGVSNFEHGTFRRENTLAKLKDNYVASLDQLITEEDKIAERIQTSKMVERQDSEDFQQTTSRFKVPKTASVATFGQQGGNFNTIGGNCAQSYSSPTATLSPPTQSYWRMEEKPSDSKLKNNQIQKKKARKQQLALRGQGGVNHSASNSIVSKYISQAFDRQQNKRTHNQLAKPVLEQKHRASLSSHQSLRISTQADDVLSSGSRHQHRIAPSSTTSTVLSHNLLKKGESSSKQPRRILRSKQNQQKQLKQQQQQYLQTQPSNSNNTSTLDDSKQYQIKRIPRLASHSQSSKQRQSQQTSSQQKAMQTKQRSVTKETVTSASKSVKSRQSIVKANTSNSGSRQSRFNRNSVNLLHSQKQTVTTPTYSSNIHRVVTTKQHRYQQPTRSTSVKQRKSTDSKQFNQTTVIKQQPQLLRRPSSRYSGCSQASHGNNNYRQQTHSSINSRASSRLQTKSPVPELDISATTSGFQQNKQKGQSHQDQQLTQSGRFIDQTEDEDEPALANLRKFQSKLVYVGNKIDHYARLVTLKKVRDFSSELQPLQTAYLKAGRTLCLLLKAFTCMDNSFRQIKEDEVFKDWSKVQQYLNSEQGENQIKRIGELRQFCELHSKFCDKKTLLVDLRKNIFRYTLNTSGEINSQEIDLESPRVKTSLLKPIFCLAYFVMTYVTLQGQILEQLKQFESMMHHKEEELEQAYAAEMEAAKSYSPDKSQSNNMNYSPDVKIANIAINNNANINNNNNTTVDYGPLNSSQATVHIAAPRDSDPFAVLSSTTSMPGSCRQSRSSVIRCTPEAIISPLSNGGGGQKNASTTGFFNQVQKMEMFGSHFKTAGLMSDSGKQKQAAYIPSDATSDNVDKEQMRLPAELEMRPISSIEDPTSSSFLQQSSQVLRGDLDPITTATNNSLNLMMEGRPDTQLSGNSSQVGGHPQNHHNLSNEVGQSSLTATESSLLIGNGILPQKQFNSVMTYTQQPQMTQQSSSCHQNSEFTFYQSQMNSQHKMYQQNKGNQLQYHQNSSTEGQQAVIQMQDEQNETHQTGDDTQQSPAWQRDEQQLPSTTNLDRLCYNNCDDDFQQQQRLSQTLSRTSNCDGEQQKMTAFISDSMQQNNATGGPEQPINVNELLKRVRSSDSPVDLKMMKIEEIQEDEQAASGNLNDNKDKLYRTSLERAFEQFYTEAATMTQSQEHHQQTASLLAQQNFDDSLNIDLTCNEQHSQFEQQQQPFQLDQYLVKKQDRTTEQILSSIKKRRTNSNERVKGLQLSDLADKIIEECRRTIQSTEATNEKPSSASELSLLSPANRQAKELNLDNQETEDRQVKCLLTTKIYQTSSEQYNDYEMHLKPEKYNENPYNYSENDDYSNNQQQQLFTPETPPFTGMKRVFGSTDFKTNGGVAVHEDQKIAFRGPLPATESANNKYGMKIQQEAYDCEQQQKYYADNGTTTSQEELTRFATLDAPDQPKHIQHQESLVIEEDEEAIKSGQLMRIYGEY